MFYGVLQYVSVSARANGRHTLLLKLHKWKAPCCSGCVAVCCSVCTGGWEVHVRHTLLLKLHKWKAPCCSECVAVCCSVCTGEWEVHLVVESTQMESPLLQWVCCSVLQCVGVYCSVSQCLHGQMSCIFVVETTQILHTTIRTHTVTPMTQTNPKTSPNLYIK